MSGDRRPRYDRSRSPPRRGSKEWISKQIVRFGRYPDRRPRGLSVDGAGSMLLSDLMESWGEDEGLHARKILDALELNRRQSGGGERFSVAPLGKDWEITVHPKRGGGMGSDHHTPRRMRTREAAYTTDDLSTKQKMDMGLDDIIAGGSPAFGSSSRTPAFASSSRAPACDSAGRAAAFCSSSREHNMASSSSHIGIRSKAEVIDLEDESFDMQALAPAVHPLPQSFGNTGWARRFKEDQLLNMREGNDRGRPRAMSANGDDRGRPRAMSANGDDRGRGRARAMSSGQTDLVKLSKFVSYLMKKGYLEHGFELWQDYANLNDLVKVLNQKRTYGEFSLQDLKNALQDSDDVGRFEFWNNWVRKVDRSTREAAKSGARPADMEVESGPRSSAQVFPNSRPSPPPGEGWTQYTDEEQGKSWWYYEGSLGKWWCDEEDPEPRVWTFDDATA